MWYYDVRYTFDKGVDTDISDIDLYFLKVIKKVLQPYMIDNTYTGAIENKNKLGEKCKKHIHFRFRSETPVVTIRRQFTRKIFQDYNDNRKLNKNVYFLKAMPEIDDDKFWRYPFKQIKEKKALKDYSIFSMSEDEAERHREVAHSIWKLGQEVNHSKIANKEPTTFIERAFHFVEVSGADTYSSIWKKLVEFYVLQDKPLDANRVKGYSYNYMIKNNLMTIDEYYELYN